MENQSTKLSAEPAGIAGNNPIPQIISQATVACVHGVSAGLLASSDSNEACSTW